MKISEKIAEVRRQPEHVRLRYVWGSVAVSMIFILAVWIFSMGSLFQGDKNTDDMDTTGKPGLTEQLQTLKDQAPSIQDFSDQALTTTNEGVANTESVSEFQGPTSSSDVELPQASAYSDLPEETLTR